MFLLWAYFERNWEREYDWHGAAPDYRAVVRHFKAAHPPATVERAARAIDHLLAQPLSERLLAEILEKEFCVVRPTQQGLTCRQWLQSVRAVLAEPTG